MTIPENANASLAGEANAESADMGGLQNERSTGESSLCEVIYSRGYGQHDNTPQQRTAPDFAAFRAAILADRGTEKGGRWIAGPCAIAPDEGSHRDGGSKQRAIGKHHRCAACALPRRFIGLDVDQSLTPQSFAALVQHLQPYSGLVYTTPSHTPQAPRCRVILELDMPAPREALVAATVAVQKRISAALVADGYGALVFDASCDRPEQPLYLPLHGAAHYVLDGMPLSLGELLAEVPAAVQKPAQAPSEPAGAIVVDADRHGDLLALSGRRARDVHRGDMDAGTAWALLVAERDRGRWTRHMDDPELRRAFDGALANLASGAWEAPTPVAAVADAGGMAANDVVLQSVPLDGLMTAALTPPRFVITPIIPRNVATLLGGHGGLGKSMLGLVLCAHVAAGRGWGPFTVELGRSVFVSLEDPGELVRYRLRCIIEEYQLPARAVLDNLRVFDGADVDAAMVVESRANGVAMLTERPMMQHVAEAAAGAALLVIDNASDAYGADEIARAQVRVFMRKLGQLARANDGGVVLLAHVDKAAAKHGALGNSYSGSTAWHNSARSRLALVEEKGAIELRHEKANLSRRAEPLAVSYAEHGVIVPAAIDPSGDTDRALATADADAVMDALRAAWAAGLTVPTAVQGSSTGWHALNKLPELGSQYQGRGGRDRVLSALVRLQREGHIIAETYTKPNRHRVERWILAPNAMECAA
ncbi:AAA family ATPase [Rhodanobacter sp. Si-c]|uniref:AAA family ATPase n=1 Tax=Rhodanobacter lycopersici TaxID=3162487 RepID=A0ABV3QAM6_9GAMM